MSGTRKSMRKLERKAIFYDPYLHTKDSSSYSGYFGDLLSMLDEDFQNNQYRIKHWLGQMLDQAIGEWHLAPRDPLSARDIFAIIQRHANKDHWGRNTADSLSIPDKEYSTFLQVSERLSFGYVAFATYYLRKEQVASLRSGARYHPSFHTPVELVYLEDHLLYG